jgi:HsdM-like protein
MNLSSFIWSVADLLRGKYKPHEYGQVILPFTVLRRMDCVLEPTKQAVLKEAAKRDFSATSVNPFLTRGGRAASDAAEASFTDLLDDRLYFTAAPRLSRRHKVRDNLLGMPAFCPVLRRTQALTEFVARALGIKANEVIGRTGANVVARAASFLLLADSRASFEIEGE